MTMQHPKTTFPVPHGGYLGLIQTWRQPLCDRPTLAFPADRS